MTGIFRRSLLARVLFSSLGLAGLMVLGVTGLFLWNYTRDVDRQIVGRANALAEFLAGQSQFAMLVGDRTELERVARNAAGTRQVTYLELTDAAGGTPVRYCREGLGSYAPRPGIIEVTRAVTRPASVDGLGWEGATGDPGARLGQVRLGFSSAEERAAALRLVWITAGLAVAALFGGGALLAFQLRSLLRPLYALTEFTHRVAAGDLGGRAPVDRPDEVGRLTMAFNRMVERLGESLVSKEAAEAANAAKGRFLATMSHELRTPLNAVIGYAQLVEEECRDRGLDHMAADLRSIDRAANLLLDQLNQILDFSRAAAGKIELELESFEIRPVIQDVFATVGPIAVKNGNRLSVEVEPEAARIHADVARFRQSLLNLVANACKFTRQGDVAVRVRRDRSVSPDAILVSVKDSGIGISPVQKGRLFQAFVQGDASTTRKYGGSGLGLAISRELCRMMGGDITVESELGKGSDFVMRIPAEASPPAGTAEERGSP